MRKIIGILSIFLAFALMGQAQKIKVACVGNSVTYGYGIKNRETNCYPAQLQRMLGDAYKVENFGHSGATLLNKGYRPYTQQEAYQKALKFAGDYVIIHLGLNDTDPRAWPNYRDDFVRDYLSLIESFRKANPRCKVWVCRMTPISHRHPRFKSGTRDWYWMEQALIEEIARIAGATLVDLQEGLYDRPDLLPDALHPNAEGADILARTVYGALTGDYGGLQLPAIYSDRMVLQRDQPLPISGIANQGEKVTVTLAGQRKETVAGTNGKWTVTLDPLPGKREILYLNGFYPQPHAELSGCSSRGSLAMLRTIQHGVPGKRERKGRTTATIGLRKTTLANPFIRPKAPLGDLRRGMGRFRTGFIEPPAILPRHPMGSMRHAEYRTLLGHRICLRAYAGR